MNSSIKLREAMHTVLSAQGFFSLAMYQSRFPLYPWLIEGFPSINYDLRYAILIVNIVILVLIVPFTVVLNALVIFIVGKKTHLQTVSNVALACLSATVAMVGIFVRPLCLYIGTSSLLTRELSFKTYSCSVQIVAKYSINFFCSSSLVHLALMTAERYMAIKHTYTHSQVFTKTRVLKASAVAWIVTAIAQVLLFIDQNVFKPITSAFVGTILLFIIFSNVMLCRESRRHETCELRVT